MTICSDKMKEHSVILTEVNGNKCDIRISDKFYLTLNCDGKTCNNNTHVMMHIIPENVSNEELKKKRNNTIKEIKDMSFWQKIRFLFRGYDLIE